MCVYVCVCVNVCTCVWRPEYNLRCHASGAVSFFFFIDTVAEETDPQTPASPKLLCGISLVIVTARVVLLPAAPAGFDTLLSLVY